MLLQMRPGATYCTHLLWSGTGEYLSTQCTFIVRQNTRDFCDVTQNTQPWEHFKRSPSPRFRMFARLCNWGFLCAESSSVCCDEHVDDATACDACRDHHALGRLGVIGWVNNSLFTASSIRVSGFPMDIECVTFWYFSRQNVLPKGNIFHFCSSKSFPMLC